MEEYIRTILIGGVFLIGVFVFACIIEELVGDIRLVSDAPEYKEGYSLGYLEHNDTKYQAAKNIYISWGGAYTNAQYCYAYGYYLGYRAYVDEEEIKVEAYKRNKSARILGV